ncbi:unnamed protein product [Soboliphyme baturini]|uniref:N-acetylglucosamine-6-phosphate deacetylase n=1 Tax=Soboliphyme baturini TaxID=241478 RepID=A0A183IQX0_9BILA|nr:unnamed protein product [Soboliphyme baturini]
MGSLQRLKWSQCENLPDGLGQFVNCQVLRNGRLVNDHLWTKGGKIIDPRPVFFESKQSPDFQVDCDGLTIAPGFIDIQINGIRFRRSKYSSL